MTIKRRLELLPEILPKPERGQQNPSGPSPVRARALARLGVLAALGAAACTGKEGGGYGVVDPLPPPTGGNGGGGGGGGLGGGGFGGTAYGVVDPIPRPATCDTIAPPQAWAEYLPGAVDAGVGAASDAGVLEGDAGVDGGVPSPLRQVRLELDASTLVLFGQALPIGSNVSVLRQVNMNGHSTIDLLIEGASAEVEITSTCGLVQDTFRASLTLGDEQVFVTLGGP